MRPSFLSARRLLAWGLVLLLPACIDPYTPDVVTAPRSFLVVDGFINSQGVTSVKLTRTFAITNLPKVPTETRASVAIEDAAGGSSPLTENPVGTYTSLAQTLNPAHTYRLRIRTAGGQDYASDYVPVKLTPPLDNVEWRAESTGLGVYVSTHDATNATQYYRWEYDETWEIIPPFSPSLEFYNNAIIPIRVPFPTICWGNERSPVIQLAKTTALSQDVVSGFLLRRLPRSTDRLYRRYSILVQQHALTKDEYDYWELLRKNTESIGTLFDPQPSQLTGNVHCLSNADELALGFVGAHSLQQQRIFITRAQLPNDWPYNSGYTSCLPPDTAKKNPIPLFRTGLFLPIGYVLGGVTVSSPDCIDCRRRGAATRPSFW